jgi:hypothetical protein
MDITCDSVGPNYLGTMGIRLTAGRDFTFQDHKGSPPVVIVNQTMAARYWPGAEALGRRLKVGDTWHEVVGVARDIVYRHVEDGPSPAFYLPVLQNYDSSVTLVLGSWRWCLRLSVSMECCLTRSANGLMKSASEWHLGRAAGRYKG